ncbi:MAG: prealbumin-like fold domain-containing protein, partial [Lachnospiraceae bacterium]|nr:prealbumin-like fold domain-containing protein [Lachnospiraceae bacterium]
TLDKKQRRMFAQTVAWAIRCQADWAGSDTISQHKSSVITQLNNAMANVNGISKKYSAEQIYDYIFKTDWSSYKVRVKFFKTCKYDSKGNVVDVSGYQHFMNIKIVPEENYDWETVGASEGYHQRVRVHKTDELGNPLSGVKFRLTLRSDTDNVYDYRVSLADGSMADTDDVSGSYGIDNYGNDYLIATTNSSGYAYFYIARNNSIDDAYGYITSPSNPSESIIGKAMAEMAEDGVAYYTSKAAARAAAEKAIAGARSNIHDDAMIREEESSLPDAYTTLADYTVYNRRTGGNGATTSTYSASNKDISSASEGILVSWDQNNVYFKDSNGKWVDEQATSTGLGTKTHGNRNDVSEVNVVDKIKKIQVMVTKKADTKDGKAHGDATLDGAEYQLYSDAACTKKATVYGEDKKQKTAGVYTTAKGGVFITDYLLCGVTYYLKEIKPSEGFLLSNEIKTIKISGAEMDDWDEFSLRPSKEYIEVNEPHIKNDINIFKIRGEDTGEAEFEHDVTFQVYLKDAKSYDACDDYDRRVIVTDKYGRGTAEDLPYGEYTVHQVDTGLYDTEKVEDFFISIKEDETQKPEGYHTVLLNNNFKAYLKIRKTDANTGKTVLKPDTVFEIFRVDPDTGEETQVIQTGSNGKKMITLKQFTTDEEGTVETLHELESGTYRIREVESAPGLHQVKDYIEVEINSKNDNYKVETDPESKFPTITVTVDYENEETHGQLSIAKKGEQLKGYDPEKKQFTYEEAYLKGVTFEVYAKEDIATQDNQGTNWYDKGELVATIHTGEDVQFSKECEGITGYEMDEDGVITLDLPLGEYTIQEKNTLYGYVLPDKDWDVSFTWENKEASYVFDSSDSTNEEGRLEILNLLAKARVSIQKQDNATYKPVQGAVFGLYTADDIFNADGELIVTKDTLLDTVTTDGECKAASAMYLPLLSEN